MAAAAPATIDFDRFHRAELPRRLAAGHGALAAPGLRGRAALALRVRDGNAYTYTPTATTVAVIAGDGDAPTLVELDATAWDDFIAERRTVPGLLYAGMLRIVRGDANALFRWEPTLRTLFYGRPPYDAAALDLRSADGAPLDLATAFDRTSAPAAVAHFLATAGFAVVRAVFTADEIAALGAEADRVAARARPGDRGSWWARTGAGDQVLCRVTYTSLASPTIAALNDDCRVRRLVAAYAPDFVPAPDRLDGIALILKNAGVVDGLSDLPWHIDCGMGGHAMMCPVLQFSILLDAASPATGTLQFLAGSHRCAAVAPTDAQGGAVVTVDARPGDCILHLSDTMHAAPAPGGSTRLRRSLVTSFYRPSVLDLIPAGQAFNDVLLSRADGHVESLRTQAGAGPHR